MCLVPIMDIYIYIRYVCAWFHNMCFYSPCVGIVYAFTVLVYFHLGSSFLVSQFGTLFFDYERVSCSTLAYNREHWWLHIIFQTSTSFTNKISRYADKIIWNKFNILAYYGYFQKFHMKVWAHLMPLSLDIDRYKNMLFCNTKILSRTLFPIEIIHIRFSLKKRNHDRPPYLSSFICNVTNNKVKVVSYF